MIIGIIGGIGSGKSVLATKRIIEANNKCFCNFSVNHNNALRIRKDYIIEVVVTQTPRGKDKVEKKLNWEFWNTALRTYGDYNIVLDEAHNLIHSRQRLINFVY